MSIGKVKRTVKAYLNLICVLLIAHAKAYAKAIEIMVATTVLVNELSKQV